MASEFHRRAAIRLFAVFFAPLGSLLVSAAVVGSAAIVAQMSGCCGSAPTHGCKFIEAPKDASMDMSSDAPIPCGFDVCVPGVTTCCLEANSEPPIRCIALGQVCMGPSGNCAGNADCPAGANQVCCGTLQTMSVQCQAPETCPGDFTQTVRVCRSDAECPANIPKCSSITVSGLLIYVCSAS